MKTGIAFNFMGLRSNGGLKEQGWTTTETTPYLYQGIENILLIAEPGLRKTAVSVHKTQRNTVCIKLCGNTFLSVKDVIHSI
jgi:hypothetical protein